MKKLKLGLLVDQSLDHEVEPLSDTSLTDCYSRYNTLMGGMPSPQDDITPDQLGALHALLEAGRAPPGPTLETPQAARASAGTAQTIPEACRRVPAPVRASLELLRRFRARRVFIL